MNSQEILKALKNRQRVYGTLIVSSSPEWPIQVQRLGLDFVFIDLEHIAINRTTLSWMCQAYSGLGLAPIVRITRPDPQEAAMVIDAGAQGVIAPYIETAEQVQELRGAVKLRPIKGFKLQSLLTGRQTTHSDALDAYIEHRNNTILIAMIESQPAVERIDEILSSPQLDGVLIGPHDLSCSLGIPEQYTHPEFEKAVRRVLSRAYQHQISAGIHYTMGDIDREIKWIREENANIIIHQADLIVFAEEMRRQVSQIRSALGDLEAATPDQTINI